MPIGHSVVNMVRSYGFMPNDLMPLLFGWFGRVSYQTHGSSRAIGAIEWLTGGKANILFDLHSTGFTLVSVPRHLTWGDSVWR